MLCRPNSYVFLLVVVVSATACVNSTNVGLSNARTYDTRNERADKTHDVIANGDDSCGIPGSGRRDPIPMRLVACPGDESSMHRVAARD